MPTTVNLIVIRVADLDRSQQFFESLGITFSRERHGNGPEHLVAKIIDLVFEIYPLGNGLSTSATRLGFQVDSLQNAIDAVVKCGAEIVTSPADGPWGIRAVIKDLDGHRIELCQTV